jgi:hypothetical protein
MKKRLINIDAAVRRAFFIMSSHTLLLGVWIVNLRRMTCVLLRQIHSSLKTFLSSCPTEMQYTEAPESPVFQGNRYDERQISLSRSMEKSEFYLETERTSVFKGHKMFIQGFYTNM